MIRFHQSLVPSIFVNPTDPPFPREFSHLRAVALRCFYTSGIVSRNDRARVHFPQRIPQHIATPLLLYGSVHSLRRKLYTTPEGSRRGGTGARARALSCTHPWYSVYVHFGIRRMDASPSELDPGIPDGPFDSERRLSCASGSFRYSNYSSDDI